MRSRDLIFKYAAENHGFITTRAARGMGVDPALLRQMAARGTLERVARAAYRLPFYPTGEHDYFAEAVAWTNGRGVISHESALVLHGFSDVNPTKIHITVPANTSVKAQGGERYRVYRHSLKEPDITRRHDVPVTSFFRTILDCVRAGTNPYQLELAVKEAEEAGEITNRAATKLNAVIAERPSVQRLRRLTGDAFSL